MPQIIPGGRPRSSSDGDILDEGLCGALFVNLNDRNNRNYTEGTRKTSNVFVNINNNNTSTNNLNSSNDTLDSDSKLSSPSQSSAKSGSKGLTFKSMRKAVSRVFVKDSRLNDSAGKKYEKTSQANGLSKVWTPDLRYLGERVDSKFSSGDLSRNSTLSTSRPLITNSKFGMAVPRWKTTPGAVGIYNHGNNCFMNAVLQCLSNTDSFTEYFIRDFFKNDLKNSTNGKKGVFRSSHGEVTEQLGNLLKCLWSGKYSSDVSKEFKTVVGKFNNQYKGDDQQDAQEFLLWLLDCIHEDVSSFSKKKVKSQKTPVVMTDKELASEAASANGDSFILKLFQALHSSTLTCPTCGERSSTFDPYLCVSLPLPQRCVRVIYVIVVYLDFQDFQEVRMAFTLNQNDGILDLREQVAADAKIPLKQLLLVQLKDDSFGATYSDDQPLSDIQENDVVYALETYPDNVTMKSTAQEFDSPTSQLLVIHVEVTGKSTPSYRFGSPSMLKVRRDITLKNLQMEVLKKIEDSVCEEVFTKTQKLNNLFLLRVHDGRSRKFYLPSDVEMPLYSQLVERAYTNNTEDCGPLHIKIIAEWDSETKSRFVLDDQEHIESSPSVAKVQNSLSGQGRVSLEECFRLYTQEERLIGDDAWLCPYCRQQQQGTIKTLGLWSLPEVLILHLKRFKQTGPRRSKLNTLIDFPVDGLDMSSHLSHRNHGLPLKYDDYIYDLLGVSNHYGNMMGGHYTAYCRSPIDGEWREYNDTRVRILEGPVATREAYILFYQRRSLTKHVNQRLFTGDHWIYSFPQTSTEGTEMNSTNLNKELTPRQQYSRSRSASPSSRQNNRGWNTLCIPTHSLTPQPVRRMMSYANRSDSSDESSPIRSSSLLNGNARERSRSKQRQSSESRSDFTRETFVENPSYNKLKDPTITQGNRSPDVSHEDFVVDSDQKTLQPNLKNENHSHTSIKTADMKKPLSVAVSRQDSPRSNDSLNTSKTGSHQVWENDTILKPHATAPASSNDVSTHQIKQDNRNVNYSPKFHHPPKSDSEIASKKLAQIMKQDIINRAGVRTEDKSSSVRADSRKNGTQNILDLAKVQHMHRDNISSHVPTNQASINGYNHDPDNFVSNTKLKDHEFKHNMYSYSTRFDHRTAGGSIANEDLDLSHDQSEFRHNELQFHKLLKPQERYFTVANGSRDYNRKKRMSRFIDDTAIVNADDVAHPNKSATISRTFNTSQAGRFERTSMPHSNTDHDIHYSNSSIGPPPSPTPPHSLREEQTLNHAAVSSSLPSSTSDYFTSSHRSSRETHSQNSHELTRQHLNHQNTLNSNGSRTLTRYHRGGRYHFRPLREMYVDKIEPVQKNITNISNPCLRESSV